MIRAALPQVARGRVAGARAPVVQARSAIQTSSNHRFFSPRNLLSRPCAYARHRDRVDALHNPSTRAKFRRPSRTPSWGWTLDGGSRSLAAGRNDAVNGRNAGNCGRSLADHQLAVSAITCRWRTAASAQPSAALRLMPSRSAWSLRLRVRVRLRGARQPASRIQWATHAPAAAVEHMRVDHGGGHVRMAEQLLHRSDVIDNSHRAVLTDKPVAC